MNFTASGLAAGILFGVCGIYLLGKGRREANPWSLIIGVTMLLYPYAVSDDLALWGIGIALFTLGWYTR